MKSYTGMIFTYYGDSDQLNKFEVILRDEYRKDIRSAFFSSYKEAVKWLLEESEVLGLVLDSQDTYVKFKFFESEDQDKLLD